MLDREIPSENPSEAKPAGDDKPWSGPLPPPEVLEAFEKRHPGAIALLMEAHVLKSKARRKDEMSFAKRRGARKPSHQIWAGFTHGVVQMISFGNAGPLYPQRRKGVKPKLGSWQDDWRKLNGDMEKAWSKVEGRYAGK